MPKTHFQVSMGDTTPEDRTIIEQSVDPLREIIARLLSHPDTGIFPDGEVTVQFDYLDTPPPNATEQERAEHVDRMSDAIQITVGANYFGWRYEIRDQLAGQIMAEISPHLPLHLTAWTWLDLKHAGFAKRVMPPATT